MKQRLTWYKSTIEVGYSRFSLHQAINFLSFFFAANRKEAGIRIKLGAYTPEFVDLVLFPRILG